MTAETTPNDQYDKLALEVEHLRRQNEKLSLEIRALRTTSPTSAWEGRLARFIPVITALVAFGGLWYAGVQYYRAEEVALDQQRAAVETLRLELKRDTAKPLWDQQLTLYIEAAELASTIATTKDDDFRTKAEERFWVLYWGPLAAVEDVGLKNSNEAKIEAAMVRFGKNIESPHRERDLKVLKSASLSLAHAIREALAPTFDVETADLQNLR